MQLSQEVAVVDGTCSAWTYRRKSENLTSILDKITELSKRDQERIMHKGFRSSNIELSESLLMTNADSIHEGKLAVGVLGFLKRHPTKAMKMRTRFASLVHSVCGTNIEDEDFF